MKSVHELRKAGNLVRVFHHRPLQEDKNNKLGYIFSPRGGSTQVLVKPKDDPDLTVIGNAFCSNKDNYNKKRGVQIALGRALKTLNEEGVDL